MAFLLIVAALTSLSIGELAVSAPQLKGTVIAVKGFEATIRVESQEPYSPAVGNQVELLETNDAGRVVFIRKDWEITEVQGAVVKAKPINATVGDLPKVNMKAFIHVSAGPVHAGEVPPLEQGKLLTYDSMFPAPPPVKRSFSTVRGRVIMTRGNAVTIQMDKKDRRAAVGDFVKLSYPVDGEVIPVGTWRVSAVKEDGRLEALVYEIKGQPSIGMEALIFLQDEADSNPKAGKTNNPIVVTDKPRPDSVAIYSEALRHYKGDGVPKDHKKAFGFFKEAGEMGHDVAQVHLGWMYQLGEGVAKDPVQAKNWYQKAADQNNANAKNNLGLMYLNGEGVNQDYALAGNLFKEAAGGGNSYGYWNLGQLYDNGWGVEKNQAMAFSNYLKAAEMGHLDAQVKVGHFYTNGTGINKDYSRAYPWFKKAADSGSGEACNNLGLFYLNGFGVDRDYTQAHRFFEKAADKGYTYGYFNLGRLYDNGWGVSENKQKALEYYARFGDYVTAYRDGARKGHEEAKQWLRKRNMDW
jgi:TPR repeat protein